MSAASWEDRTEDQRVEERYFNHQTIWNCELSRQKDNRSVDKSRISKGSCRYKRLEFLRNEETVKSKLNEMLWCMRHWDYDYMR